MQSCRKTGASSTLPFTTSGRRVTTGWGVLSQLLGSNYIQKEAGGVGKDYAVCSPGSQSLQEVEQDTLKLRK